MEGITRESLIEALRQAVDAISVKNRLGGGLLSRSDAATLLGVSERTLRRMEISGQITSVRVGSSVRYRQAEIDKIMEGGAA